MKYLLFIYLCFIISCNKDNDIQNKYVIKNKIIQFKDSNFIVESYDSYQFPDTLKEDSSYYLNSKLIVFSNLLNNNKDTLYYFNDDIKEIQELSNKLNMNYPFFNIIFVGGSDIITQKYFTLKDSLEYLFEFSSFGKVDLYYDNNSLIGEVIDRDSILYHFQKYPIIINLNSYDINIIQPTRHYIDFETTTINDIYVYNDLIFKDSIKIKSNSKVYVDSAFYDIKVIKLKFDNRSYFLDFESARENIYSNAVG